MSLFVEIYKEWMELARSYRLLVVIIVLVFFGLTSPLAAKFTPEIVAIAPGGAEIAKIIPPPTVWDAIAQYIKNMPMFGLIMALLITMGAIAQEKDKGTAAMMLVKPLTRGAFLGAKFLSLAAVFGIAMVIAGISCFYYTLLLFESVDVLHWLILNVFLYLYVLDIIAITLLCSTVTRSQAAAAGIAIGLVVIGWVAGALGWGKYLPGELATWSGRLMHGDTTGSWIALGVSLGIIVVSLLASWLVFRRQEL